MVAMAGASLEHNVIVANVSPRRGLRQGVWQSRTGGKLG